MEIFTQHFYSEKARSSGSTDSFLCLPRKASGSEAGTGKPIQGEALSNLGFCRRFVQSAGLARLLGLARSRLGISNCSLPSPGSWSWLSKASSNNEALSSNMDGLNHLKGKLSPLFLFFLPLVLLQVRLCGEVSTSNEVWKWLYPSVFSSRSGSNSPQKCLPLVCGSQWQGVWGSHQTLKRRQGRGGRLAY